MPKFKGPDGRIKDSISKVLDEFCDENNCICTIGDAANEQGETCNYYATHHPEKAAHLMGYEIIEDDCDQIATKSNSEAMTIEQYQKDAARTAAGKCRDLSNAGLGLTGEAGEVADIIKKHLYQGHDLPRDKIVEELGDLMWYVSLTASLIGVDLKAVMQANIEKLWRRYPNGFRPEDSVHREDEK